MTQQYFASSAFIDIFERRQQRADDRRLARVERAATVGATATATATQRTASTAQIGRTHRPTFRLVHVRHVFRRTRVAH